LRTAREGLVKSVREAIGGGTTKRGSKTYASLFFGALIPKELFGGSVRRERGEGEGGPGASGAEEEEGTWEDEDDGLEAGRG
jgi:hypothetical protein